MTRVRAVFAVIAAATLSVACAIPPGPYNHNGGPAQGARYPSSPTNGYYAPNSGGYPHIVDNNRYYGPAPGYNGYYDPAPGGNGYYDPAPGYPPPYAYGGVEHPLDQGSATIEWNNEAIRRRQRANEQAIRNWHGPARTLDEISSVRRHWDHSWGNFKRSFKIK